MNTKNLIIAILTLLLISMSSTSALAYSYSYKGTNHYVNSGSNFYGKSGIGASYYSGSYIGPAFSGHYTSPRYGSYGRYSYVTNTNGGFTYRPWRYTQRMYGNGRGSTAFEVYNQVDDYPAW